MGDVVEVLRPGGRILVGVETVNVVLVLVADRSDRERGLDDVRIEMLLLHRAGEGRGLHDRVIAFHDDADVENGRLTGEQFIALRVDQRVVVEIGDIEHAAELDVDLAVDLVEIAEQLEGDGVDRPG